MEEKKDPKIPKKMPIQVGNSNQHIRGLVVIDRPAIHVRITVEDLRGEGNRVDEGIAQGPFDGFCDDVFRFRAENVYPKDPTGGTRTIDENVLEPYWLRFRQAFEIWREGEGLDQYLQVLWEEYREDQGIEPNPVSGIRKQDRENFKNALKTRLKQWKKNKNVS